jgi:hypothetical protein
MAAYRRTIIPGGTFFLPSTSPTGKRLFVIAENAGEPGGRIEVRDWTEA